MKKTELFPTELYYVTSIIG